MAGRLEPKQQYEDNTESAENRVGTQVRVTAEKLVSHMNRIEWIKRVSVKWMCWNDTLSANQTDVIGTGFAKPGHPTIHVDGKLAGTRQRRAPWRAHRLQTDEAFGHSYEEHSKHSGDSVAAVVAVFLEDAAATVGSTVNLMAWTDDFVRR